MVDWVARLIPVFPLLACLVTAVLGPRVLRQYSHLPTIIGCAASSLFSLILLAIVGNDSAFPQASRVVTMYQWMVIPGSGTWPPVDISISLYVDALSAIMLSMLTFVATLVAIYGSSYMQGDRSFWRFFALVSLFVFNMIMLVLSANFLQLFMFWEGVGLCSYGLIGFWYEKPEAAAAGMKAFVVNRIGDFGFLIGLFLAWITFQSVDFTVVLDPARVAGIDSMMLTIICLCLFTGAVGKSAQFPLHVWLPDAMEGPTPVSALIHAATMVTAGVYLTARCTVLFTAAPQAQLAVSFIGAFTALLAAAIALTQTDLKRVLAYSTVSQLGFMFLGLGTGSVLGISAAMFHLVTHAFFKALLFLGAGSVMHSMGGVIDMRQFRGLRNVMPHTYRTFLVGSLALAGLAPLSGFWSKDAILSAVYAAGSDAHHGAADHGSDAAGHAAANHDDKSHAGDAKAADGGHAAGDHAAGTHAGTNDTGTGLFGLSRQTSYLLLFWSAAITACMTSFYTFRAFFMTFHGELKLPPEAHAHAHGGHGGHGDQSGHSDHGHAADGHGHDHGHSAGHGHATGHGHTTATAAASVTTGTPETAAFGSFESPPRMTIPLYILAVGAVVLGIVLGHTTHLFDSYLGKTIPGLAAASKSHGTDWFVVGLTQIGTLIGIAAAFFMYAMPSPLPATLAKTFAPLYRASHGRFYLDELYLILFVLPLRGLSLISRFVDWYIVDGLFVQGISKLPAGLFGRSVQPLQNGLVQFYSLTMGLMLAVLLLALLLTPALQ